MLADNSAGYPRVFVIEARLSGSLDREALESAWVSALTRHPLLGARVAKTWSGWQWVTSTASAPTIDWRAESEPLAFANGEMIDLAHESGVRLWVRTDEGKARLVLQFHHACCDGVAGLQFVGDVLAEYARRTSPDSALGLLPELNAELLRGRGTFGLTRPAFREWLGHVWMTLRESWRLLGRSVTPVALPTAAPREANTPSPFPGHETYLFDQHESEQLHQAAKQAGATLNDLLMCHLLGTIADWNSANGQPAPDAWLRMNVPTNLRRREDLRMPAANVMSFTFVDRRVRDCQNGTALLASIRDEMETVKERRLGLYFIAQLAMVGRVPGGMRMVVSGQRCFATAVLTNLGDATKAFPVTFPHCDNKLVIGNMLLESLAGTPPLRPLTRVGVAVTSYAGQLMICVLCDRHRFTREQTSRFLDAYVAQIRKGLPEGDRL